MTIVVNGVARDIETTTSVAELVRALGRDPDQAGTAIARNGDVLPRRHWADTLLADGDTVEVVAAVGGG